MKIFDAMDVLLGSGSERPLSGLLKIAMVSALGLKSLASCMREQWIGPSSDTGINRCVLWAFPESHVSEVPTLFSAIGVVDGKPSGTPSMFDFNKHWAAKVSVDELERIKAAHGRIHQLAGMTAPPTEVVQQLFDNGSSSSSACAWLDSNESRLDEASMKSLAAFLLKDGIGFIGVKDVLKPADMLYASENPGSDFFRNLENMFEKVQVLMAAPRGSNEGLPDSMKDMKSWHSASALAYDKGMRVRSDQDDKYE